MGGMVRSFADQGGILLRDYLWWSRV